LRDLTAVFPFHWIALLPLIEMELMDDQLEEAVGHAKLLLHPHQHRLPDAGSDHLVAAADSWVSGDAVAARASLALALKNLKVCGYQ
jgi:hypothetical protein